MTACDCMALSPSECIVPSDVPSALPCVDDEKLLEEPNPETELLWFAPTETPSNKPPMIGMSPRIDSPRLTFTPIPWLSDHPPPDEEPCPDVPDLESVWDVPCDTPSDLDWLAPTASL